MCVLSDDDVIRRLGSSDLLVDPFTEDLLGPDSLDLRLSDTYRVFRADRVSLLRPSLDAHNHMEQITQDRFILHPRNVVTAFTLERVRLPADLCGFVTGRSGLARLGLQIASAVVVHAGWEGYLALELVNLGGIPIELFRGMPVCQISFLTLTSVPSSPYGQRETDRFQHQGRGS